ncbi:MAG: metallopeptidase TldD-related protein [Bacteroidota bacterium]|jgi:predicted Zn-dependent protease|nr:metallopeptidase TldD-related protein [Bacteroidota bacterium]
MMTRHDAETILSIAVQSPGADELFVSLTETEITTRSVAGQHPHPLHHSSGLTLAITARVGTRYGRVSGNVYEQADIRALVARAATLAAQMPETTEVLPFPGAIDVAEAATYFPDDGGAMWEESWRGITSLREDPTTASCLAFGSIASTSTVRALASSNGLFVYQPSSLGHAQFRCYTEDGRSTGFAERFRPDRTVLAPRDVLRDAVDTCLRWRGAKEIKPGRITTIFSPRALADMLQPMLRQFSTRAIADDQSFLRRLDGSSFLGSTLFDTRVTLRSDPYDARVPSLPFTADGEPVTARHWVSAGVIAQLVTDRYEAAAVNRPVVAPPSNLIIDVADPVADLIADTEYGLLLHGFANLNILDPKNCLLTGSTRDGLFLIEKGRIVGPVRNLILRETPVYLFKELQAFGMPEVVSPTGSYFPMLLPPMKVKDVMYSQPSSLI